MKVFNSIFNPFVSNGRFEANTRSHIEAASHFFNFSEFQNIKKSPVQSVDFYFEAQTLKNAHELHHALTKMNYTLDEIVKRNNYCFFVTGQTNPFYIDQINFMNWVSKMNEVGFIYDCLFDGWGIMHSYDD